MLVIRPTQMALLGKEVERHFIDGLADQFARLYPNVEDVRDRVIAAIDRARGYEMRSRDDIEWFVDLDLRRGFEWEKQPEMNWALEILDNPGVDPAGRRFRLEKWLRKWDGNGD
jgi:hypothetical protein